MVFAGIIIILNSYLGVQGVIIATPDSTGYTCQTNQDIYGNIIVGVQNGGSSPGYIHANFYFVIY